MPILAGLFAGLFGALADFFVRFVTKKTAFGLAAISVFSALTIAVMATFTGFINSVLVLDVLPDAVVFGFWYFMPSSFPAAFASVVSAHIAAALYRWNVENVRLMAYVS